MLLLEDPVARMVVKLTDAQKNYGDGGLYIVAFACKLIINCLQLQEEYNIPPYVMITTNEIALSWILEFIQAPNCPVKQKVR